MLTNSNRLGKENLFDSSWRTGIVDIRTHQAAKADGFVPNFYGVNSPTPENGYMIGRYTGKSFSIATQDGTMQNLHISDDGTKMYIVGTTNDRIYQYSMSTPYDVSTSTFVNFYAFGTTVVDPTGLYIAPDGKKLFVLGSSADTIYSYTFVIAWDVTTLTYDSKSFSVTTQEATPRALAVKPDGTKFWIVGTTNDTIYEYNLSTAWDLATASYASISLSVTAQDATPFGLAWNSTGTSFFILGGTNDQIYSYSAVTAWTLTGASHNGTVSGSLNAVIPVDTVTGTVGYYFVPGTKNHYVVDNGTDKVYWLTSRAIDGLSAGVNSNRFTLNESYGLGLATPRSVIFRPDGLEFFISDSTTNTINEYSCTSAWTITGATLVSSIPMAGRTTTANFSSTFARFFISSDGSYVFMSDFSTGNLSRYVARNPWNMNRLYFTQSSSSTFPASSNAFCFSWDGLNLYYVSGTTFYRRSLTSPWDLNTISVATTYSDATYLGGTNTLTGIYISQDGLYLYGLTAASARVYKYSMSTPYDITTATFNSTAYIEDINPDPNGGLFASPNGDYMFVTDQTNDTLYKYVMIGG